MVERTDELRDDIERRRQNISHTVDELQNRVSPGRIMSRGRFRIRRWVIDKRDQIMGNEHPYYPWQDREQGYFDQRRQGSGSKEESITERVSQAASEVGDRVSHVASETGDRMSEVKETVTHAPDKIRQQTRGNPMAAGLIAFGGGLLLATILPKTRTEHDIARRLEPTMSNAMSEARDAGRDVMEDVKEDAEYALEQVKGAASEAGQHLKDDATDAAERTRDRTQNS